MGGQCVDGDDGPTCQKGDMMPEMPACDPECAADCSCLLGRCVCEGDGSMGDMWKIVNCAADIGGKVKKACKNDCSKDDATLQSCTECVKTKTKCLQGSAPNSTTTAAA